MKNKFRRFIACLLVIMLMSSDMAVFAESVIKTLTLPVALQIIDEEAFYGNTSIEKVVVPDGTTEIRSKAFANSSLTEIELSDTLKFIADDAFEGCDDFTVIAEEGSYAYQWAVNKGYIKTLIPTPAEYFICKTLKDGTLSITGYTGEDTDIVIPDTIAGKQVTEIGANAFNPSNITSVVIPEGVTSIGNRAFRCCCDMTEVSIPSTVTHIGDMAFHCCESLREITIPDGVAHIGTGAFSICGMSTFEIPEGITAIGDNLFEGCYKLTSITIPDSVSSVGEYAFHGCNSLASITLPDNITSIGDYAFYGSGIESILLPSNIDTIGKHAFRYCESLEEVALPEGMTKIGDNAFRNCTVLKHVSIPKCVTDIGEHAFSECLNLSEVVFAECRDHLDEEREITEIPRYSFYNCSSLETIELPASVVSIGDYAFFRCTELKELELPEKMKTIESGAFYGSGLTEITIPGSEIKSYAFIECEDLTKVIISQGTKTIGYKAFADCPELTSIVLPEGLTSIDVDAFSSSERLTATVIENSYAHTWCNTNGIECVAQKKPTSAEYFTTEELEDGTLSIIGYTGASKEVVVPGVIAGKKVTKIGETAFKRSTVQSVVISENVTTIDHHAFYYCANLKQITIPEGVTYIGESAFYGCTSLSEIVVPEGVTTIKNYTFHQCTSLTKISLPQSVTTIEYQAFSQCSSLKKLEIPKGVTAIGKSAFSLCKSLNEITIPYGVTVIDQSTFSFCYALTKVSLPEKLISIGSSAFTSCSELVEINIPDSVATIESSAFSGCSSLTEIHIPKNVTSISSLTFMNCTSLTEVDIHEGVTTIDYRAFRNCTSLMKANLHGGFTFIGWETFYDCPNLVASVESGSYAETYCKNNSIQYIATTPKKYFITTKLADGTLSIADYTGDGAEVVVPEQINGTKVTGIGTRAFENASVTSVVIPESVTTIDSYAFNNCQSLKSIIIPEGVCRISDNTFTGCSSLVSVKLPETITSIGNYAFRGCSNLVDFNWPSSLETIGQYAFNKCHAFVDITLPEKVTRISTGAFEWCENLESIKLPENLITLDGYVFYDCGKLKEVNLPNGISAIGNYTFYRCTALTSIELPAAITRVGSGAFMKCSSLTEINLHRSITNISSSSFSDCESLIAKVEQDSYAHQWCTENGVNYVFMDSEPTVTPTVTPAPTPAPTPMPEPTVDPETGFEYWSFDGVNCSIRDYIGSNSEVVVPEKISGFTVNEIGFGAFANKSEIKSVILPDTIVRIGLQAFINCGISEITIPKNVEYIAEATFEGSDLAMINVDDGNEAYCSVDGILFSQDKTLLHTFPQRKEMSHYTVPNGVIRIANSAFQYAGLTSVTIAESVEEIGQWAFWNCGGLQTVYIPKNVKVMDEGIFTACWQLTEIVVDEQNTNYCSIDGVLLTKDLSTLCAYPIGKDNKTYTVPEGVKRIEVRAFDSSNLESVILTDGVLEIAAFAFDYSRELTRIRIPASVKTISEEAFRGTNTESLTIYGEIGSYAEKFADDNGMTFVAGDIPESICEHANTRSEYLKTTYAQITGNEEQHQMIKHYKVICDECNATLDAAYYTTTIAENHDFDANGKCNLCDYQKCQHSDTSNIQFGEAIYNMIADDEKHQVEKHYKVTCIACGEILDDDIEELTTEDHVFNQDEKCTVCGYEKNCSHTWTMDCGEYSCEMIIGNEQQHETISVSWKECRSCGEVVGEKTEVRKYEDHSFDERGWCGYCGYQMNDQTACDHSDTSRLQIGQTFYNQIDGDDETHQVEKHYRVTCDVCGETIESDLKELTTEDHSFDESGLCTKCQYQMEVECDHADTSLIQVGNPSYKQIAGDDEIHQIITYYVEQCDLCGAIVKDGISETTSERHTFDAEGVCEICGYEKCLHTETIKEYVKTTYAQISDNAAQHQVTNHYKLVCDNCEQITDSNYTESLLANHTFDSANKCTVCGYEKEPEVVQMEKPVLIHPALSVDEDVLPSYSAGDMTLVWGVVEGAIKYTVQMEEYCDGEWDEIIREEETTEETFMIYKHNLEEGCKYRVRIRAYGPNGERKISKRYYFRIGAASYIWAKEELELDYKGDKEKIVVYTTQNWEALVSDESWIDISAHRGYATTTITIEVTANKGDFPRTGTITFTNDAGGYAVVTLIQEGNGSGNEGTIRITYPEQGETVEFGRIDVEWRENYKSYSRKVELYDLISKEIVYSATTTGDGVNIWEKCLTKGHTYRLTVIARGMDEREWSRATIVFAVEGDDAGGDSGTEPDDEVIETPEVPEGNTELIYSGIVHNSKIDKKSIDLSWQEVIGRESFGVVLRDMTVYPDGTPDDKVKFEIYTTTENLKYQIPSDKLVYGHTYRLWIGAYKNGLADLINGKEIVFTVESVPLKWQAVLSDESTIKVNVVGGTPDANTPYLFIAEDADGLHYPGNSTPNIAAGATSATFKIKNLQMKRAKAYDLYVLPAGVSLTDANRTQYSAGRIVVPLWSGNMISRVYSGSTDVTSTKKVYKDEDVKVVWEASYGVYNVEVTALLNGTTVFTKAYTDPALIDRDEPVTTIIDSSEFKEAEVGDKLVITVTVTPTAEAQAVLTGAGLDPTASKSWKEGMFVAGTPSVKYVSIYDSKSKLTYDKNNPMQLVVGEHNYSNGYDLRVELENSMSVNWTVYTDDVDVARAYRTEDGKTYVHAKKRGTTMLYISDTYADDIAKIDRDRLYAVCRVNVSMDGDELQEINRDFVELYQYYQRENCDEINAGYYSFVSFFPSIFYMGVIDGVKYDANRVLAHVGNTNYEGDILAREMLMQKTLEFDELYFEAMQYLQTTCEAVTWVDDALEEANPFYDVVKKIMDENWTSNDFDNFLFKVQEFEKQHHISDTEELFVWFTKTERQVYQLFGTGVVNSKRLAKLQEACYNLRGKFAKLMNTGIERIKVDGEKEVISYIECVGDILSVSQAVIQEYQWECLEEHYKASYIATLDEWIELESDEQMKAAYIKVKKTMTSELAGIVDFLDKTVIKTGVAYKYGSFFLNDVIQKEIFGKTVKELWVKLGTKAGSSVFSKAFAMVEFADLVSEGALLFVSMSGIDMSEVKKVSVQICQVWDAYDQNVDDLTIKLTNVNKDNYQTVIAKMELCLSHLKHLMQLIGNDFDGRWDFVISPEEVEIFRDNMSNLFIEWDKIIVDYEELLEEYFQLN